MLTRHFVFTINNYTPEEIQQVKSLPYRYLIIGYERGDKENTPHLQGYCSLLKPARFTTLKKVLPRAHIEKARGDIESNYNYCSKSGCFEEFGTRPNPGERKDLDMVRYVADTEGMRVVTSMANLQQIRVAEKYLTYNEHKRDWKPEVIWLWGAPGSGKSRYAREITVDAYTKSDGTKWWDGYDKHADVIIDDFRDSWWNLTYFLALIDRYPFRVEYKGGYRQFLAKKIIVTSVTKPEDMYKYARGEPISQLLRRIDFVTEVEGNTKLRPS